MSMNHSLKIRPDGALDFLALGALVHRLDPGLIPFRKATQCEIHVSGGEFNCAANLADAFGLEAGVATAMSDYPIGDLIAARVRAMGVKAFYKIQAQRSQRAEHGRRVQRSRPWGARSRGLLQSRQRSRGAAQTRRLRLECDLRQWRALVSQRRYFRGTVETTGELIVEGMRAARAAGAVVSFDLNYREKLWNIWGGAAKAADVISRIVQNVDVLVGNEEDLQKGLGIAGPEVTAASKLDPGAFIAMIDAVVSRYPQIKVLATTLREVHTTNRHSWSAVAWFDGKTYTAPACKLDVYDRVGGGDGFASGLFYGLLSGESPEESLRLGWLTSASHDLPGRHDDGDGGTGPGLCKRRVGSHSAVTGRDVIEECGHLILAMWCQGPSTRSRAGVNS